MDSQNECLDRRHWMIRAVRHVLLAGIGAMTAVLLVRRVSAKCPGPSTPCRTCRALPGCRLPRSRQTRQTLGRK